MLDPKAVAETMDYITDLLGSVELPMPAPDEDGGRAAMKFTWDFTALGRAVGAAKAIRLLCEAEGRPKTRGVESDRRKPYEPPTMEVVPTRTCRHAGEAKGDSLDGYACSLCGSWMPRWASWCPDCGAMVEEADGK